MAAMQSLPSRAAVSGAQQLAAAAQAAYGRSDYKECVRLGQQAGELLFGSVLTPKALADGTTIQSVCAASQAGNPELYSSAVSCLLLLSAGYFCLRDFPAALAFALQAAKAAPHAAEPLSNMANVYRELGDVEKAAVCYRQALKANPASADAAGNLASLLMQTGEQDEAMAYFERAVAGRPTHVAWTVDLGHLYRLKGRLPEARACFQKAVSLNASFALAWHNLGCVLKDEGDSAGAIRHLRRAIELAPSFADSYAALGNLYKDGRMLADAERTYGAAMTLRPDDGITLGNLAATQLELGRLDEALSTFARALKLVPDFPDALSNYGNALRQKGRPQEALAAYKRCLELTGNRHTDALNNAANVLKDLGDGVAAESYYRQALALRPRFAGCLSNLANLLREKGELEEALRLYDAAIEAEPSFADPHNNRGNCLKDMGRFDDAVAAYQRAIAMRPEFPDAYGNCAAAYKDKGDLDSAIVLYRKALSFKPRDRPDPIPFCNYLHCMQTVCDWSDRDALFRQACAVTQAQMTEGLLPAIQPHHALVYPLTAAQQLAIAASYSQHARKAMLGMGAKPVVWAPASTAVRLAAVLPLALRRTLRPELLQALSRAQIADAGKSAVVGAAAAAAASEGSPRAEASAAAVVTGTGQRVFGAADGGARDSGDSERADTAGADTTAATSATGAAAASDPAAPRRLRVAFVSSDLGDHPLSHLMRHVFIWMDRRRFEVHCYATAPDDGSSWRREIAGGVEAFHDAAALSHAQLAALIHSHGIDVAINLNGFTKGSRSEAFALCPAPVQVMYLGFPGSSGSAYHQYVVTDGVTTPVELGRCFTERLAHMPRSYFVNDHAQAYGACAAELTDAQVDAARVALGLPPRPAVVYCMHNQLYKCDPRTFDAWARILARVPNSVLWLLQFPPSGEAHIRQEARARGLAHWRFVFSPVAPKDEHIQRLRVADLFLDTPLCNAHTTGTDALWAGVPLLTLPQETMASRVAASLLQSIGCPELIQPTLAAYEEVAVALGSSLPRLRALQAKVRERRFTAPLFDTRAWVRDWERLLMSVVHDYICLCQAGVDPAAGIAERAALALAGQRLDAVKPGSHAAALGSGAVAIHPALLRGASYEGAADAAADSSKPLAYGEGVPAASSSAAAASATGVDGEGMPMAALSGASTAHGAATAHGDEARMGSAGGWSAGGAAAPAGVVTRSTPRAAAAMQQQQQQRVDGGVTAGSGFGLPHAGYLPAEHAGGAGVGLSVPQHQPWGMQQPQGQQQHPHMQPQHASHTLAVTPAGGPWAGTGMGAGAVMGAGAGAASHAPLSRPGMGATSAGAVGAAGPAPGMGHAPMGTAPAGSGGFSPALPPSRMEAPAASRMDSDAAILAAGLAAARRRPLLPAINPMIRFGGGGGGGSDTSAGPSFSAAGGGYGAGAAGYGGAGASGYGGPGVSGYGGAGGAPPTAGGALAGGMAGSSITAMQSGIPGLTAMGAAAMSSLASGRTGGLAGGQAVGPGGRLISNGAGTPLGFPHSAGGGAGSPLPGSGGPPAMTPPMGAHLRPPHAGPAAAAPSVGAKAPGADVSWPALMEKHRQSLALNAVRLTAPPLPADVGPGMAQPGAGGGGGAGAGMGVPAPQGYGGRYGPQLGPAYGTGGTHLPGDGASAAGLMPGGHGSSHGSGAAPIHPPTHMAPGGAMHPYSDGLLAHGNDSHGVILGGYSDGLLAHGRGSDGAMHGATSGLLDVGSLSLGTALSSASPAFIPSGAGYGGSAYGGGAAGTAGGAGAVPGQHPLLAGHYGGSESLAWHGGVGGLDGNLIAITSTANADRATAVASLAAAVNRAVAAASSGADHSYSGVHSDAASGASRASASSAPLPAAAQLPLRDFAAGGHLAGAESAAASTLTARPVVASPSAGLPLARPTQPRGLASLPSGDLDEADPMPLPPSPSNAAALRSTAAGLGATPGGVMSSPSATPHSPAPASSA